jgi:hypothetical protein
LHNENNQTKTRTHLDQQGKTPKPEARILLEDAEKSCHAKHRVMEGDIFDNRQIFGDNLLASKLACPNHADEC